MAQFDLYANPSAVQREAFPYVVVLQSDHLDHYSTRLVMPLARLKRIPETLPRRLALTVNVDGETLHLASHLCAPLPARLLKEPLRSLRDQAPSLLDALDAVISGV